MNKQKANDFGEKILEYCKKFQIPVEYLFEILEDQKVTPMIRGKAMEYNAYLMLDKILPGHIWSVQKLNLNPQQNTIDEDISITHRRSGIILKVESKSAVRGSFSDGKRARYIKEPHFKVKCHRSRSNLKKQDQGNDAYPIDAFDILITNPLNAIYQSNTIGENLEVINKGNIKSLLYEYYGVDSDDSLVDVCYSDWRYVIPEDIGKNGFIPRTPYVILKNDPNWDSLDSLESELIKVVEKKRGISSRRS